MADEKDKFDPIREFTALRDNLSKVVEQSVKGVVGTSNYPAVDVYETADSVVVRTAPIDGITPESVEVSMENGVLTISGNTVTDSDLPEGSAYISRERRFGTFNRSVRIPRNVQADAAQARFKHGILTITLPKIADKRPQVIEVTPAE